MLARQRRATRPQVKMIGLVINIKVKRRPSDQSYSNGWSLKIDWPPTVLTEPTFYTQDLLYIPPTAQSTIIASFPFDCHQSALSLTSNLPGVPIPSHCRGRTPVSGHKSAHDPPVSSAQKCTQCTIALVSVHTSNLMLRGSRDNTVLGPKLTASMLRDHYVKELHVLKVRGGPLL